MTQSHAPDIVDVTVHGNCTMPAASRREFLKACALTGSASLFVNATERKRILVERSPHPSFLAQLAERELLRGLTLLQLPAEIRSADPNIRINAGDTLFRLRVDPGGFPDKQAYSIAARAGDFELKGGSESSLVYAVFDFLEHQGAYFGVDGEAYPPDAAGRLILPNDGSPWNIRPRFAVRGLLPWPDFLNCITVYNDEDFRAYFEAMLRMRFNMFGMHVYSSPESTFAGTESYLSFSFAGAGEQGFLDNSGSSRWGSLPERTSHFGMSGAQFFSDEVFGADSTVRSGNTWQIADRTREVLHKSLAYAKKLGIATGIGFEPYQLPGDMLRALPPHIKPKPGSKLPGGAAFDVESVVARKLLEARLGQLLDAYPDVDYVWLWEDENMNWESRKTGVPLSVTPFQQAYDFLRRSTPQKKMVLAGWGGVVRHFEYFHKKLPLDIVFSCLNDSLGWDPVSEVFEKLEGRERWPVPWLEDDPGMWLPQFHVNRTQRDVELAARFGCQGILGIHWRNRIMDATAGYLARSTWNQQLTPAAHFADYSKTQTSADLAPRLAAVLNEADLHQNLLHTGTDERKDDHVVTREWAADYDEGFLFWRDYEPETKVAEAQKKLAAELRSIADSCRTPVARERSAYLAGFVGFTVPYTEAWTIAHRLNAVLEEANRLKADQHPDQAKRKTLEQGVPLFLKLAPLVRQTMLEYQNIVANRSDLGQLASMHNKYVRLSLFRLPLSIEEYVGDLPSEVGVAIQQALRPDTDGPTRVFVPTRCGFLRAGEQFRVMAVVTGSDAIERVTLHTRERGMSGWKEKPAKLLGRRTYEAVVGPFENGKELGEYFVSASIGGKRHLAPLTGPQSPYLVTLV